MKRKTIMSLAIITALSSLIVSCGKTEKVTADAETQVGTDYDATEDSQVELLPWTQLADLETHPELRTAFEEYLNITGTTGNKEGILYTNPLTTQADQNITLLLAIKNSRFRGNFMWEDALSKLGEIAAENYTDVEADDINAPYATVNAYFELLPDQTEGQFDGDSTISRAQAMTLVMRAITPVNEAHEPETNQDFTAKVGESQYTDFAAPMNEYSYINTENGLTDKTFNTTMSRGEYIYMLANYYSTEYQEYLDSMGYKKNIYDENIAISAISDAGDITFADAIAETSKGVPTDMYKSFQMALNMNLITEDDLEDWDSAITKCEAVRLFTAMTISYYQDAGVSDLDADIAENKVYPEVNPETVDPKTTNMDAETATALGHIEMDEIEAQYGSTEAYDAYAQSQGADGTYGWCWVYYNGKAAGNKESYAVYMKEDSPRYGEVFHLGDYLPCGGFFVGANNEEHGIADDRELIRMYENGEFGDGVTMIYDENGQIYNTIIE